MHGEEGDAIDEDDGRNKETNANKTMKRKEKKKKNRQRKRRALAMARGVAVAGRAAGVGIGFTTARQRRSTWNINMLVSLVEWSTFRAVSAAWLALQMPVTENSSRMN